MLLLNFGGEEERAALKLTKSLREADIACEIYPENAKMKKQMEYANRRGVPYVAILGSDELAAGTVTVKNMGSGEQQSIAQAELINLLK